MQAKQIVSNAQISEVIEKIKTSETPAIRNEFASQLFDLMEKSTPKNIDEKTLDDMLELLNIPEIRIEISASFRFLKSRAKKAVPRLIQVLNEEECERNYVDLFFSTGYSAADVIRSSLKQIGIKKPVVVNCNGNYYPPILSSAELKNASSRLFELNGNTDHQSQDISSDSRRNGQIYNPDGIELVYVEGTGNGIDRIKSFYIGKFEITQEQWKVLMVDTPLGVEGENLPVDDVSWNDVQEFLLRLNTATGRNYRLPNEAEWHFAARGGTVNSFCSGVCKYSGSNNVDDVAWTVHNSGVRPHPVGTKQPNELGIHDMSGNVWEWCEDRHNLVPSDRVIRGGGWRSSDVMYRVDFDSDFRIGANPDNRYHALGFRVALSPENAELHKQDNEVFDFNTSGPEEFLEFLKKDSSVSPIGFFIPFYTIIDPPPDNWIKPKHIPGLINLIDSKEPCRSVMTIYSSTIPTKLSTVGDEAMFLIEGFREKRYPPWSFSSTYSPKGRESILKWWKKWSKQSNLQK